MGKFCEHEWSIKKIDMCVMTDGKRDMPIGVPVYQCKKCGVEK